MLVSLNSMVELSIQNSNCYQILWGRDKFENCISKYLHRQRKLGENNFRSKDNDNCGQLLLTVNTVVTVLLERGAPFQTCWAQGNL